jgi:hypothetical protein
MMRRRTVLTSWLSVGLAACARGARPPSGGPGLILFLGPPEAERIRSLPHETLGALSSGEWAECGPATARAAAEKQPPRILYFDRHSYDSAVARVTTPQRDEAVKHRLDRWTPEAKSYLAQRLFDLEAARWEGLIRSGARDSDLQASLSRLQRLAGLERYVMVSVDGMAVAILEEEARLIAGFRALLASPGTGESPEGRMLRQALADRERWSSAALKTTQSTGGLLPRTDAIRGVYLPRAGAAAEGELRRAEEPFVRWRDGLLLSCTERQCSALARSGSPPIVLYDDASGLEEVLEFSTTAQRDRDLAAQLARDPARRRHDTIVHLSRLSLQQLLLKRELCTRTNCNTNGMAAAIREEEKGIGPLADLCRPFSGALGWQSEKPADLAQRAAAQFLSEAALYREWASHFWPSLAPVLARATA